MDAKHKEITLVSPSFTC